MGLCMKLYSQYREAMKTGDVIAFSGNSRISKIIKWKTDSQYSHVGIVMDADAKGGIGKAVLMVESTALCNQPDVLDGKIIKGVQLHFLSNRLDEYDGKAWWLPLKEVLPHYAAFNMQQWLRNIRCENIKYDDFQALGTGADIFDWIPGIQNDRDFSSLFCSELVARALQIAGVVNDNINPSEQTPADIAGMPCFEKPIQVK